MDIELTMLGEIASYDNLLSAYDKVAHGKRSRPEFMRYALRIEENIINLSNRLANKMWRPHGTVDFYVIEPKLRFISRPVIEDRIVHHAICNVIEPILEKYWSFASYACIKGRGNTNACIRLQRLYRSAIGKYGFNFYVISGDFKSFFKLVNLDVYRIMLEKVIKDRDTVELLMLIAESYEGEGLPIGFLTSQHAANLVLSAFDYLITDILGIGKWYVRQMDDFRIIVKDKETAYNILNNLYEFADNKLHQPLSDKKTRVWKFKGCDKFCGYIIRPHRLSAISDTAKRHERRITKHNKMFMEGRIAEEKLISSVSGAIDYFLRTNRPSKIIDDVILNTNIQNKSIVRWKESVLSLI